MLTRCWYRRGTDAFTIALFAETHLYAIPPWRKRDRAGDRAHRGRNRGDGRGLVDAERPPSRLSPARHLSRRTRRTHLHVLERGHVQARRQAPDGGRLAPLRRE